MAAGTSINLSSRFRAVTMTSTSSDGALLVLAPDDGFCETDWAWLTPAINKADRTVLLSRCTGLLNNVAAYIVSVIASSSGLHAGTGPRAGSSALGLVELLFKEIGYDLIRLAGFRQIGIIYEAVVHTVPAKQTRIDARQI